MKSYSISPKKDKFEIPNETKSKEEISIIKKISSQEREKNKEIVVVQGLGFVGAVMAAVIADCEIQGKSPYFVLGVDLPTEESYWKIATINQGISPFNTEDPEVDQIFKRTVLQKSSFKATWVKEAYSLADIVVVDINLDVIKLELGNSNNFEVRIDNFKNALIDIGQRINPEALVLIETTVPPGTVEKIILPTIETCFKKRKVDLSKNPPLIAHSYERVMPGKYYLQSVNRIWRSFSAVNDIASQKTKKFLKNIINTKNFPILELGSTNATEMGKILENSYRAMNIAFIYEWTLFAEDIGVNLFEVIDSIRVRKGTHDNMMYPGFGVGGYCLPKDSLLAEWASKNLFNRNINLNFSLKAIDINDLMPHHTFELLKKGMKGNLIGKKISILGASYRKDVDDTRNSPTIVLYDDIKRGGGNPIVHDPYAQLINERYDIIISNDLESSLKDANAVVFVVDHKQYKNLSMESLISKISKGACVIDAFNILSNDKIKYLKQHNHTALGIGKGHIKYL